MTSDELLDICKSRGEMEFLFQITKKIAEADSIGEGFPYYRNYTEGMFNEPKDHTGFYNDYLQWGGLPVYELYLQFIGAIDP